MSLFKEIKKLFGGRSPDTMSLTDFVNLAADDPTTENRDAFYARLVRSKVGARVSRSDGSVGPAQIPTSTGPDGIAYLIVFSDVPAMAAAFPDDTFVELEAKVVLQMAKSMGGGMIVQNGEQCWAGVPKDHVDDLLAGRYA